LVRRSIELLEPIADAQLDNVLLSRVLAMDETPIKAGMSKAKKGRMHQGYYWPVYGDQDEVCFIYSASSIRIAVRIVMSVVYSVRSSVARLSVMATRPMQVSHSTMMR